MQKDLRAELDRKNNELHAVNTKIDALVGTSGCMDELVGLSIARNNLHTDIHYIERKLSNLHVRGGTLLGDEIKEMGDCGATF